MSSTAPSTCLLVHLAGSRRGTPVEVGAALRIGTGPDVWVNAPWPCEQRGDRTGVRGSNLGVPADLAGDLLTKVAGN